MNRTTMNMLLAGCTVFAVGTSAALADCAEELAALQSNAGASGETGADAGRGGVAKDGSLAPLEEPDEASNAEASQDAAAGGDVATTTTAGEDSAGQGASADAGSTTEISKDGTEAPLAGGNEAAGESGAGLEADSAIALSQQDAEAQQELESGSNGGMNSDALERAQAALDRGDEAACMEAVEEARG